MAVILQDHEEEISEQQIGRVSVPWALILQTLPLVLCKQAVGMVEIVHVEVIEL